MKIKRDEHSQYASTLNGGDVILYKEEYYLMLSYESDQQIKKMGDGRRSFLNIENGVLIFLSHNDYVKTFPKAIFFPLGCDGVE